MPEHGPLQVSLPVPRREFLSILALGTTAALTACEGARTTTASRRGKPSFRTRGVVISAPDDIPNWDWPEQAHAVGLSTIATHKFPSEVAKFANTDEWARFRENCHRLDIAIEHELHAMYDLLPRDLFDKNPEMFRMNEKGERTKDYNLCVHSPQAIQIVCENAVKYSQLLPATTGRYFYWSDDCLGMCRCPKCRIYADTDQVVILENAVVAALRRADKRNTLAHLAYETTWKPPTDVKPDRGLFLEWAPIHRKFDTPIREQTQLLDNLDAQLAVFGADGAQVLDYCLDESLACGYRRRQPKPLPWNGELFRDDLQTYKQRGIRHYTSFAVWVNNDYVAACGEPPLRDYGEGLLTA